MTENYNHFLNFVNFSFISLYNDYYIVICRIKKKKSEYNIIADKTTFY